MSLPAEPPREALLRDEALLDAVVPDSAPSVRWWVASSPAVVIGLGLRHRLAEIVDIERCRAAGVEVLERRAGGGAVLVDAHMLCGAICLPRASVVDDVTESYRWVGDLLLARLRAVGVSDARRVDVAEARADVAVLKSRGDHVSCLLLATCYGALSPHEIAVGAAKLVGLAQVRRRHAVLFQFGILVRDQSPLADYLKVPDEATRGNLRTALSQRTVGLESLGVEPDQLAQGPW
jgi:lipoate---protein ligase